MPEDSSTDTSSPSGQAGLYDFATFLAGSLGRSLPFIIVLCLIAYGAYYGIGKAASLSDELNKAHVEVGKAQIEKTQAQADAAQAANIAKTQALKEYTDQLLKLNSVSTEVSKHLQDLVSTQLDNMKKANDLNETQDKKSRALQDQIAAISKAEQDQNAEKSKAELEDLRAQIAATKKERDVYVLSAAVSSYNEISKQISSEIADNRAIESGLFVLLVKRLEDPNVAARINSDASDALTSWPLRFVLYLALYHQTSDIKIFNQAIEVLRQHKRDLRYSLGFLIASDDALSREQRNAGSPTIAELIVDTDFTEEFRDQLVYSITTHELSWISKLTPDIFKRMKEYQGNRLIESVQETNQTCDNILSFVSSLNDLDPEAALVYATEANVKAGGTTTQEGPCIRQTLTKAIGGRKTSSAAEKNWPLLPKGSF